MKNKKIECLQEDASLEQVISKINEIIEKLNCELNEDCIAEKAVSKIEEKISDGLTASNKRCARFQGA